MKAVVAAALLVLSPPPPVCLPRAQILLAAGSEYNAGRGAGRSGHAASLQKIIDRGEAATLEEAQLAFSRQGHAAALWSLVDRGEAETLEEAQLVLSRKGNAVALQNMVDRGEAATLEEAGKLTGVRMRAVTLQNMVDRGEAATVKEAQQVFSRQGRAAFDAKYSYKDAAKFSTAAGVKTAKKKGYRSNHPGVRWQKKQDRKTHKTLDVGTGSFPETSRGFWRVSFTYKGKYVSVGSGYKDEEAAARAHDDYVREHNLQRRLHFPRTGEDGY